MSGDANTYIFHEVQDSMLCGQHALNNLLQESLFTPVDLAEIAQGLDAQERAFMTVDGVMTPEALKFLSEKSGNVDESGNFSLQVLRAALQASHDIQLVSWTSDRGDEQTEMTEEHGFIINRSSHWFTVRKIKSRWWNLNSTLDLPEVITEFYLTAFLSQLIGDGYSVFQAKGKVPPAGTKPFGTSSNSSTKWYTEKVLLSKVGGPAEAASSFPGTSRRLVDRKPAPPLDDPNDPDFLYNEAIRASKGDSNFNDYQFEGDDDPELAMAIALSTSDINTTVIAESTAGTTHGSKPSSEASAKDIMRQKRLDALSKRGL